MKRLAQIAALVVVALLFSCSDKENLPPLEPVYTPRYAKGFTIERDPQSGAKYLIVRNPWQGAEGVLFRSQIDTLNPPKRIVTMSSSHAAMLDAVGCANRIVGLSGCRYIYTPSIRQAIERGEISEVGYDSAFDFERVCQLKTDLVLLYGVAGEAKRITNKLEELGIPYIYIGEYLEAEPLGKAEWIVAIASLCGVEERGQEFFDAVAERYNTLRKQNEGLTSRPRVMLNLPYRDTWFMPPHNSYMVRLIEDAGGEYVLTESGKRKAENGTDAIKSRAETACRLCQDGAVKPEGQPTTNREQSEQAPSAEPQGGKACEAGLKRKAENGNTSTAISLEEALELALQCDFWINLGQFNSKQELRTVAPHFAEVDAVRHNRLYNNTKRTNESRGSDFWESGAIRPDLILADLVKILHHRLPTDSLYYYKRLE